MGNHQWHFQFTKRWGIILFIVLLLEIFLLAIFVSIWAQNRYNDNLQVFSSSQVPFTRSTLGLFNQKETPFQSTFTANKTETNNLTIIVEENIIQTPQGTSAPKFPNFLISPVGKIVYTCFDGKYDQICLMNADGSENQQLTFSQSTSFYPSLSPSGDHIIFSSNKDGNFEIYLMDTDGNNMNQLTNNIGNLYAPEISPKLNRIIFTNENGGIQTVWVMKIDGSNARPLVESYGSDIDPTWSPDGNQIAFTSRRDGRNRLFIANSDGSKLTSISPDWLLIGGRSSWSPDGFWLVFYAGESGAHQIYQVGKHGEDLVKITQIGDNLAPSYSPDGEWIAFTSFRDGNNEIYILHLESLAVFRLTNRNDADWQPRWGN